MSIIYLIGYMGVGKSTIGKKLARKMNCNWIDLDREIEVEEGNTITTIFETKGETSFRNLEQEKLKSWSEMESMIISCGGGTPMYRDNMDYMLQRGIVVHIYSTLEIIIQRINNNIQKRPLLAHLSESELKNYITKHYEERKNIYNKAHILFQNTNKIEILANMIQEYKNKFSYN